jgi:hypothetical protein
LHFHVGTPYLASRSLKGGGVCSLLVPNIIPQNGDPVQSVLGTRGHRRLQETLV